MTIYRTADDSSSCFPLWALPDTVLYHLVCFVAPPTQRATVICHQLAPLSSASYAAFLSSSKSENSPLWEILLRQDYKNAVTQAAPNSNNNKQVVKRRESKRLKQSMFQQVQHAHQKIQSNTTAAFHFLAEMSQGSSTKPNQCLSLLRLRKLLSQYAPLYNLNRPSESGGLCLIEVCRARHVKESTILACVKELVELHGAAVNAETYESPHAYETALCVAATRGMPTVLQYLLAQGADPTIRCAGRFRLIGNDHVEHHQRTAFRKDVTPLEFARAMRDEEINAGTNERDLVDLRLCIQRLEKVVDDVRCRS